MLIKPYVPDDNLIAALEARAAGTGPDAKHATEELRIRKAGIRGEKESAYLVDFEFAASQNWAVLHNLRLEHGGRVAQIDHLLINRWMEVYVLETKHFHSGIKITDDGEFLRWNDWKKRFEGMASPLEQNDRHIQVLADVFSTIQMPTRAGLRIEPSFNSLILVAPSARIDRPKSFDTSRVIKADQLKKAIWKDIDGENLLVGLLKTAAKVVSGDTVRLVAERLAAIDKPLSHPAQTAVPATEPARAPIGSARVRQPPAADSRGEKDTSLTEKPNSRPLRPECKACKTSDGQILYGKYGYYLKCASCATNTAIRFTCLPGHSPRLRKEGQTFFRECGECSSSQLFHTNT